MTNLELLRMLGEEGLITFSESCEDGKAHTGYINNEEDYGLGIEILFNPKGDVAVYHRCKPQPRKKSIFDNWGGLL